MVAARLRRDAVQSRLKIDTIDAIIETVREAEGEAGEDEEEEEELEEEEKRTRFLQRVLLDYLAVNGGEVSVLSNPIYLSCFRAGDVRFGECRPVLRFRDPTFGWERFSTYHSALLIQMGLLLRRILHVLGLLNAVFSNVLPGLLRFLHTLISG